MIEAIASLDNQLRWAVRVFLLVGVCYLVFFKQTDTKTVFIEPSANMTR